MRTVYEGPGPLGWLEKFLRKYHSEIESEQMEHNSKGTCLWRITVYRIDNRIAYMANNPDPEWSGPDSTTVISEYRNFPYDQCHRILIMDGKSEQGPTEKKIQKEISRRLA